MTEFMEWTKQMSVGIDLLDDDHKRLFDMINSLFVTDARNQNRTHLHNMLVELLDYTNFHFGREEEYMERCHYPGFDTHKAAHQTFITQVTDLKNDFDNGNEIMLRIDLILLLKDWLLEHIQTTDQLYRPFVNPKSLDQTA